MPAGIHAGGLRYHGMSPSISTLANAGYIEPRAVRPEPVLRGGAACSPATRGSSRRRRAATPSARRSTRRWPRRRPGEKKVILFNLSGHGHFDMAAYDAYLAGQLIDNGFSAEAMAKSLATVPQ